MEEVQEGVNIVKKGMKFIDESEDLTTCLDYHGEPYWDNETNPGLSLKNKNNKCCNLKQGQLNRWQENPDCKNNMGRDIQWCGATGYSNARSGVCSKPSESTLCINGCGNMYGWTEGKNKKRDECTDKCKTKFK